MIDKNNDLWLSRTDLVEGFSSLPYVKCLYSIEATSLYNQLPEGEIKIILKVSLWSYIFRMRKIEKSISDMISTCGHINCFYNVGIRI